MSGNDAFVDHLRYEVHCDVAVVDRPEDIDEDVIKIAFQTPEVDQPAALEYFERLFSDRVDVMTSGTEWTDFIGFDSQGFRACRLRSCPGNFARRDDGVWR